MTSTCPCCKKQFKQLSLHLYHKPQCALFMKQYASMLDSKQLDSLPIDVMGFDVMKAFLGSTRTQVATSTSDKNLELGLLNFEQDQNEDECWMEEEPLFSETENVYCHGINYQHFISKQNVDTCGNNDFFIQLQLLQILEDIGAPLYAFEKIMNWSANAYLGGYKFPSRFSSRDKMVDKLSDIFCMKKMVPSFTTIQLHDGKNSKVNHFDFEQMCYSLLSDETIMKDSNFSFGNNGTEAFKKPRTNTLSGIEDGEMFQNTVESVCTDEHDFLLGIKMFIDATHTDVHGEWVLDPVSFTFTFLNNKVTRERNAWRTLGFINDLNKKSTVWNNQITAAKKLIDYHAQLSVILQSIAECQSRGGFFWDFKYEQKIHKLKMKPVLILVVGDAVGNHKLAGMYNNFSNTYRVNHSCDCPLVHTDDPNYVCQFVNQSDINTLCDLDDIKTLNDLSYHKVQNAFRTIQMANHVAGLHAMMPSEILHQLFLGVMENVLNSFIDKYPPSVAVRMDRFGQFMYHYGKRASDRNMPPFKTKNGFTNLTRQKGSDRLGICLLLLIMMVSDFQQKEMISGARYAPSIVDRRNYTIIFHKLLCLAEWLNEDEINKDSLDDIHIKIKQLMLLIKRTAKREKDKTWKLCKFHEMLHIVRDVRLFGPATGYDGRPGESNHKDTKQQARRTQRRLNVFEEQTSSRIYESLVIRRGSSHLINEYAETAMVDNREVSSIPSFFIQNDTVEGVTISKDDICKKHQFIFDRIYNEFSCLFPGGKIPCKSKIYINDKEIVRANESFYDGTPWNDWVWIEWDYGDDNIIEVPGKVFCFIDFRTADMDMLLQREMQKSVYAYVCSLSEAPNRNISNNITIVKKVSLEMQNNDELKFRCVNIDTFTKTCYVVPNVSSLEDGDNDEIAKNWLFVETRSTWASHF